LHPEFQRPVRQSAKRWSILKPATSSLQRGHELCCCRGLKLLLPHVDKLIEHLALQLGHLQEMRSRCFDDFLRPSDRACGLCDLFRYRLAMPLGSFANFVAPLGKRIRDSSEGIVLRSRHVLPPDVITPTRKYETEERRSGSSEFELEPQSERWAARLRLEHAHSRPR
jgi:hypothetical protein